MCSGQRTTVARTTCENGLKDLREAANAHGSARIEKSGRADAARLTTLGWVLTRRLAASEDDAAVDGAPKSCGFGLRADASQRCSAVRALQPNVRGDVRLHRVPNAAAHSESIDRIRIAARHLAGRLCASRPTHSRYPCATPGSIRTEPLSKIVEIIGEFGRDGGIRTHDPLTPSQVR